MVTRGSSEQPPRFRCNNSSVYWGVICCVYINAGLPFDGGHFIPVAVTLTGVPGAPGLLDISLGQDQGEWLNWTAWAGLEALYPTVCWCMYVKVIRGRQRVCCIRWQRLSVTRSAWTVTIASSLHVESGVAHFSVVSYAVSDAQLFLLLTQCRILFER